MSKFSLGNSHCLTTPQDGTLFSAELSQHGKQEQATRGERRGQKRNGRPLRVRRPRHRCGRSVFQAGLHLQPRCAWSVLERHGSLVSALHGCPAGWPLSLLFSRSTYSSDRPLALSLVFWLRFLTPGPSDLRSLGPFR